jgi:hypothetical protein
MRHLLWLWWPTLVCVAITSYCAWLTCHQVAHHQSAGAAGALTAGFGYLLFREVRRTQGHP